MTKTVSTSKKPRKQHSPEFRSEALKLAERIGVTAAARELSLYESQLYNWRSKQQNQQTSSAQWIQYLLSLAPDCPWQHIVFTLPCQYWSLIFHNRWLLAEMSRIAANVILEICRQADVEPGIFTVIHTWGRDQQWHPHIHLSTTAGGVTSAHTWKNLHFYARKVMRMWRYRITRLLSRKYPELVIPAELAAEGSGRREWNRFLDTHYRR
ncbi:TPA: transposase, partial [Escherichia coli]